MVSVVPQTKDQLDLLRILREENAELDFWTEPRTTGIDTKCHVEHCG